MKPNVALDPVYVAFLSAARHVLASDCFAHERKKLLGVTAFPENFSTCQNFSHTSNCHTSAARHGSA